MTRRFRFDRVLSNPVPQVFSPSPRKGPSHFGLPKVDTRLNFVKKEKRPDVSKSFIQKETSEIVQSLESILTYMLFVREKNEIRSNRIEKDTYCTFLALTKYAHF
jgi:hypothetical protein